MSEKKICFVIAPIGDEGSETRKRSDQILKYIIEPVTKECGYEPPIRADSFAEPGIITKQIIDELIDAPLVIADLTEHNANVFYELAVRHAVRKPVVQLIDREEKIPFDVGGMRAIPITVSDPDLMEKAKEELLKQIKSAERNPKAAENPISTTVDLRALRQSDRSIDKVMAEILESVQRIERQLQEGQAFGTAMKRFLGRVRPDPGEMGSLIGQRPYSRIGAGGTTLTGEYSERETPPTDPTGGPKSS